MDGSWTLEPIAELDTPARIEPTWTPERIALLKLLWDEGVTTAEIGRRIGVSKNAVVGKGHRIGLVPRIVKEAPPPRRNVFEFTGPACVWPIGHPNDEDFHFCGCRPAAGKPYCDEHVARAYIRLKEQKPEAA
jgi:GcrA cell cycle regulator